MFDESYTQLDTNEIAAILDVLNKDVQGSTFDPLETTILAIDIPFYKGHRFLDIADHATNPPLQRYAMQDKETSKFVIIDYRYQTIYDYNASAGISLDDQTVLEYVRFYFDHVKGRHGKFIICESAEHIKWKDEPPASVKKSLNEALEHLTVKEKKDDGTFIISAFMMLKDALFKTDVHVNPTGRVTMIDHEIVIEDIPVLDHVIGQ